MTLSVENLQAALEYLRMVIRGRMRIHLEKAESSSVPAPIYQKNAEPFSDFLETHKPSFDEFVVLLLAIAPQVHADFFMPIMKEFLPEGGDFPAFGGAKAATHRDIMPTGETAQFLLAGDDLAKRIEVRQLFASDHWFAKNEILQLEALPPGEPLMSGRILPNPEWIELMSSGRVSPPQFGLQFPAERLHTEMEWTDLVLPEQVLRQVNEIQSWVLHQHTMMEDWGMRRRVKPGYRALFHGPPGTGKTLTASLLAKATGRDVYRIDLSMVVSKFIGETEKNLGALFDKARNKNWMLFFDEADALFGKRTDVRDAHDKYANQEVAYLLQKIEDFPGVSILASNFKSNIDEAFIRRFQSVIHFPMPRVNERLVLWKNTIPAALRLDASIDLLQIAQKYELSGSNIVNIVQYCCLQVLMKGVTELPAELLAAGIQRELQKENKII